MVLPVFPAFCARVRAKIEHIPNVRRPQIFTGKQLFNQFFMIIRLIFFRIIALHGVGGMPIKRLASVFGNANGLIGEFFMELIKPRPIHRRIPTVPTEIMIVGNDVGDLYVWFVHATHGHARHGC